jgi:uncharacterized membrane protein YidH (DUF202 family)
MHFKARGLLAGQRTFLVWLRTSLGLIALSVAGGFVAAHLTKADPYVRWSSDLLKTSGMMIQCRANRSVKAYPRVDRRSFDSAGQAIVSIATSVALFALLPSPLLLRLR